MTGHAPAATIEAMALQLHKGLTFMLPAEDAIWVGEDLARRFGLPHWQIAMMATDADRFAIRLARHITRRPKVLVYNYCYHGTVDKAGVPGPRPGNIGPPVNPTATTKVIEMTPFHNMALIAPETMEVDVDLHTAVFRAAVVALTGT